MAGAAGAGLISFAFYIRTICPTVYGGDSGELTTVAYTLGIAHPPGYPLYTLIGRSLLMFPLFSPALTMNLSAALFASLSAFVAFYVIRELGRNSRAGDDMVVPFLGAVLWGVSRTLWSNANAAEVYALGMAVCCLIIFIFLLTARSLNNRLIFLLFYLIGLSLTNHLTAMSLLPLGLAAAWNFKMDFRRWLIAMLAISIPLTLYLYIPIRSSNWPIIDWAHPARFGEFINHITSARYRGFLADISPANFAINLKRFVRVFGAEFPLAFVGLVGLALLAVRRPRFGIPLLLAAAFNIGFAAMYEILDVEPQYLIAVFCAVCGLAYLAIELSAHLQRRLNSRTAETIPAVIMAVIVITAIAHNYRFNDKSNNTLAADYGHAIMISLPENALFVPVGGAASLVCIYLKFVEKIRPDIEYYDPISMYSNLARNRNQEHLIGIVGESELALNALGNTTRPACLGKEHIWGGDNPFKYDRLPLQGCGLYYRYGRKEAADMTPWGKLSLLADYKADYPGSSEIQILTNYFLSWGEDLQSNGRTGEAIEKYKKAVEKADMAESPMVDNALGIFFRRRGWPELALERYNRALGNDLLSNAVKADILVNIGNIHREKNSYREAIDHYQQALAIRPNHHEAGYNLLLAEAYLALSANNYTGAIGKFDALLKIDSSDPLIYYNIAVIYDKHLADSTQAVRYYNYFLEKTQDARLAAIVEKRLSELTRR